MAAAWRVDAGAWLSARFRAGTDRRGRRERVVEAIGRAPRVRRQTSTGWSRRTAVWPDHGRRLLHPGARGAADIPACAASWSTSPAGRTPSSTPQRLHPSRERGCPLAARSLRTHGSRPRDPPVPGRERGNGAQVRVGGAEELSPSIRSSPDPATRGRSIPDGTLNPRRLALGAVAPARNATAPVFEVEISSHTTTFGGARAECHDGRRLLSDRRALGAAPPRPEARGGRQLAGGVAHDFNNLLQVILGYCGLLEATGARKVVTRSRRSARRPRAAPSSHASCSRSAPPDAEARGLGRERDRRERRVDARAHAPGQIDFKALPSERSCARGEPAGSSSRYSSTSC